MTSAPTPLARYMWRFAIIYTAAMIVLIGVIAVTLLPFPRRLVSLLLAVVSSQFAGDKFVADNGRLPTRAERRRLALYSLLTSTMCSSAGVLLLHLVMSGWTLPEWLAKSLAELEQSDATFIALAGIVMAISFLFHYAVYLFAYGWLLRFRAEPLPNQSAVFEVDAAPEKPEPRNPPAE